MLNKHNERFESDVSAKKEDVIWCTNRFGESIFFYLKSLLDDAPTTRDLILSSTIKVRMAKTNNSITTLVRQNEMRFKVLRARARHELDMCLSHERRDEMKLQKVEKEQEASRQKVKAEQERRELEAPYLIYSSNATLWGSHYRS
jgi:hypothetical protein